MSFVRVNLNANPRKWISKLISSIVPPPFSQKKAAGPPDRCAAFPHPSRGKPIISIFGRKVNISREKSRQPEQRLDNPAISSIIKIERSTATDG